jgi:signal transduction histidine kinase
MIYCAAFQSSNDLEKYYEVFFDIYNPIFISLFLLIILIVLLYVSIKYIYNPLVRKHRSEKEDLEIKSAKLLASFSELDPNPIVRINTEGKVIGWNKSARQKLNITSDKGSIGKILDAMGFDVRESISENRSRVITIPIDGKTYEINFHGISFLETAQLYFLDVTEKKEYDEQMKVYQKLLRDSSSHLQQALDEEKNRFAGLLHDSIGQNLLLIKLNFQKYKNLISNEIDSDDYSRTLELLDSSIVEVKEAAKYLRPLNIDELGLITALQSMCNKISKESSIIAKLQLPSTDINLNKDLEVCIFRITQEALTNIIKHSKANEFSVSLAVKDNSATLIVSDDGIGFIPNKLVNDKYVSDGLGLLSMQDRVERLNGNFHIDSSYNNGTVIIADFELNKEIFDAEYDYKNPGS